MFTKLPAALELAPVVLFGWHVTVRTGELQVFIGTLAVGGGVLHRPPPRT